MSEKKEEAIEEICLGHILHGDSELGKNDLRVLNEVYGYPSSQCEKCVANEWNKQCPLYRPVHLCAYNVLPNQETPYKK